MSTANSEQPTSTATLDAQADDMALLRRYVDLGSQDAFNELVAKHLPWVHATCRKGLRDRHMAEDAAQAVFIVLARRAASIPPQTRLSGWLFNAARFVIKDAKKQETRYRRRENVAREISAVRLSPVREPVDTQTQALLDDALATLTERDRLSILMHFYERLSLAEMADALGITKDGAKKRVARALARLRTRLARNNKSATPVAVLVGLLGSRATEAAPLGMAQTVASSATVPGVATSVAKWMAGRAIKASAGASRRLLQALVAVELATVAVMVTVWAVPARRNVTVASAAAGTTITEVQPAAAPPPVDQPPAPAARVVVAEAAQPAAPYRSGAFDPEPRVEPLPPFAGEPKPMSQTTASGGAGGSGLVASAAGAVQVGSSTLASPVGYRREMTGPQLPIPRAIARVVAQPAAPITGSSASSDNARGSTSTSSDSETPVAKPTTPKPMPTKRPRLPGTDDAVAGSESPKPGPKHGPVAVPPPLATVPPVAHDDLPAAPRGPSHPTEVPPKSRPFAPPSYASTKIRPAKFDEHDEKSRDYGRRIVAMALRDDDDDRGHRHGFAHVRRGFVESVIAQSAKAGRKHARAIAGLAEKPAGAPDVIDDDEATGDDPLCPPAAIGQLTQSFSAVDTRVARHDAMVTPFAHTPDGSDDARGVMRFESSAVAADFAFSSASVTFQAVPEPTTGVTALAFAAVSGLFARSKRRRRHA